MFNFINKTEPTERKATRDKFDQHIAGLRKSDDITQAAVGNAINMANSFFSQTFSSIEEFTALPRQEKTAYMEKLAGMENKLTQADKHTGLGFGLFRMWLGVLAADDEELIKTFTDQLAYFSRKGKLSQ